MYRTLVLGAAIALALVNPAKAQGFIAGKDGELAAVNKLLTPSAPQYDQQTIDAIFKGLQKNIPNGIVGLDQNNTISSALVKTTQALTNRALSDRFADTINLSDYGVVCDGSTDNTSRLQYAFSMAASNIKYSGGVKVVVPFGICRASQNLTISPTDNRAISIEGSGTYSSTLKFTSGGIVANLSGTSSLSASLLHIQRDNATQGDAGLAVTGNVANPITVSHVRVDGANDSESFQTGVRIGQATIIADGLSVNMVNGPGSAALEIYGTAHQGGTFQWSIDNKIVNSAFQGGDYGVYIHGAVQGVFIANSESLGNNNGYYWSSDPSDIAEYFTISNFHANAHSNGIYLNNVNENHISGGLFLNFNNNSDPYVAININNALINNVSNNNILGNSLDNGAGILGNQRGIVLINANVTSVIGNSAYHIGGTFIDAQNSAYAVISGNSVASPGAPGGAIQGCRPGVTCLGNNYDFNSTMSESGQDIAIFHNLNMVSGGILYKTDSTSNGYVALSADPTNTFLTITNSKATGGIDVQGSITGENDVFAKGHLYTPAVFVGADQAPITEGDYHAVSFTSGIQPNFTIAAQPKQTLDSIVHSIPYESAQVWCHDCRNPGQGPGQGTGTYIHMDSVGAWRASDGSGAAN